MIELTERLLTEAGGWQAMKVLLPNKFTQLIV